MKTIFFISFLLFLSSCEVFKFTRTKKDVAIAASKTDSTSLHKKDTGFSNSGQWTREIINFTTPGRDTNIYHFTTPVNNYYPAQIIREQASFDQKGWLSLMDSINKIKKDTTATDKTETKTKTKTKVLTLDWLITVGLLASILFTNLLQLKRKV